MKCKQRVDIGFINVNKQLNLEMINVARFARNSCKNETRCSDFQTLLRTFVGLYPAGCKVHALTNGVIFFSSQTRPQINRLYSVPDPFFTNLFLNDFHDETRT